MLRWMCDKTQDDRIKMSTSGAFKGTIIREYIMTSLFDMIWTYLTKPTMPLMRKTFFFF